MRMSLQCQFLAAICSFSLFATPTVHAKQENTSSERTYYTFNYPSSVPGGDTLLTGIRGTTSNPHKVYISGFYKYPGGMPVIPFVYEGRLSGRGTWNILNYPSSSGVTVIETNLYGPNNGPGCDIQVVGNYTTQETGMSTIGCLYQGPLDGTGKWTTLTPTSSSPVLNTIAHSTMGGLVVGNYDTQEDEGKAFIYDIKHKEYFEITKTNAKSITAYGIWHNGKHSYTICGGFSDIDSVQDFESSYLVDWDSKHKKLSNWRTYYYNNQPTTSLATHFDGITSDGKGGYNLTGVASGILNEDLEFAFFANAKKHRTKWSVIAYPEAEITTGNSVYKKVVIGVYTSPDENGIVNGYISRP